MKDNASERNTRRLCKYCNDELIGRADKKFCGADCRSAYHNKIYSSINKKTRQDNRILMNNRNILHEFFDKQNLEIHEHDLLQKGYNFQFCTRILKNASNTTCYYCYDYGYFYISDQKIAIIQLQG